MTRVWVLVVLFTTQAVADTRNVNWPNVGMDKGATRYSPLKQINRSNVRSLEVAWTYHTGDAGKATTIECTPVVIDGVLYLTTAAVKAVALDAATGHEIWKFDPYADGFQSPPVNWGLHTERKRAFFAMVREMTDS